MNVVLWTVRGEEPPVRATAAREPAPGMSVALLGGTTTLTWNFRRTRDMTLLTWLIVGLIAGVLASMIMGGTGYGLIGDIVIGIVGAFVGGWIFAALHISSPWAGLPGTILVAFIGAVVLLFIIHLFRRRRYY